MSHQFSAQPTRKDKTNSKINNTKSVKKYMLINRHTIFRRGKSGRSFIDKNLSLKKSVL